MTKVIDCKKCGTLSIAKHHTFQSGSISLFKKIDNKKLNRKEDKYEFLVDCYQEGDEYYCWKHQTEKQNTEQNNPNSSNKSANLSNQNNQTTANSSSSNNFNKSNTPLYISLAIAGVLLVGIIIYFLTRKKE